MNASQLLTQTKFALRALLAVYDECQPLNKTNFPADIFDDVESLIVKLSTWLDENDQA